MGVMEKVDQIAKGQGLSLAQMKVTRGDGTVGYRFSKPQIKPWNLIGWIWYWVHRRSMIKAR